MSEFSPKVRKYRSESVLMRIVFSCLIGVCCVFLLFLQHWCIDAILDDRAFLDRAKSSLEGTVSTVSANVFVNGDSPSTVLCKEKVTFQPVASKSISFVSDGVDENVIGTYEKCSEEGEQILVLYNPEKPADARVADVVHSDLVINTVDESIFGLFTLVFLVGGALSLISNKKTLVSLTLCLPCL